MKNLLTFLAITFFTYSPKAFPYLYETEYTLDPHESQIKKFTELLPGEQIDFHSGEVGHYMETINIQGNGLPIRLGHRFHSAHGYDNDIGRMSLEVPRIEFIHMGEPDYLGWKTVSYDRDIYTVVTPYKTNISCQDLTLPSDAKYRSPQYESNPPPIPQDPNTILRSGIKIKLGYRTIDFFPKDHDPTGRFPENAIYISPSNWYIECTSSPNVSGMNAFKAISPDGMAYIFDIYQEAGIHDPILTGYPAYKNPETKIYVSTITDRHGNWLQYKYDQHDAKTLLRRDGNEYWTVQFYRSRVKSITAKDGRQINISYTPKSLTIQSNSSNPIKLVYTSSNSGNRLRITRKDGKYWEYNYIYAYGTHQNGKVISSIKYPSGFKVSYSYTPRDRREYLSGNNLPSGALANTRYALSKRVVSGIGLPTVTEFYSYNNNTTFVRSDTTSIKYIFSKIDYTKPPIETPINTGKLIQKSIFPAGTSFSASSTTTPLKQIDFKYSRIGHVIDPAYLKNNWVIRYGLSYTNLPTEIMTSTHASFIVEPSTITTQINGFSFTTNKDDYDIWGNPGSTSETNTLGEARTTFKTYHYDRSNWIIGKLKSEYIDEANPIVTTYSYFPTGKLKEKVQYAYSGHDITERYTYHSDGNLHQVLMYKNGSLLPKKTFWDYYRGIPRWERDGAGNQKRTEVYDFGKIRSETDFNGNPPTLFKYDILQRLTRIEPPLESVTTISWPSPIQKITTKGAFRQVIDYNSLMKPVLITEQDTSRGETRYFRKEYDPAGRLIFSALPSDRTDDLIGTKYTYDSLSRITSSENTADNSKTLFCYGSSCQNGVKHGVLSIDPRGYKKIINYKSFGNPDVKKVQTIKQQKTLSPERFIVTQINLGNNLETISITQGGITRKYFYKPRTLLLDRKIEPETGTTYYLSYDERGNPLKIKTGSSTITEFIYDDDDKIDFIDFPGYINDIDYQYKNQNLWKLITGNNQTTWIYEYNLTNKIKSETLLIDGLTFTITYSYDNLGNLDYMQLPRIETPSSPLVVDVTVDAFGRTRSIDGFVSNISYYPNNVISSMHYENGYSYMASLNNKRFPENIYTAGVVRLDLMDLKYYYDKSGNIIRIDDLLLSGNNRTMRYDGLGRLTEANGRWGAGVFTYSDTHNIKTMKLGNKSLNYSYDGNHRLKHISGAQNRSFQYDPLGNIVFNGIDRFTFDAANQMKTVSNRNIQYFYDGNKKRAKVITPNKTIYYIYNKAGELLYRYDATHKKDVVYINLNRKLLAKLENGPAISPTIIVDSDNDRLSDADELAWGTDPNNPDTDGDSISDGDEVAQGRNPLVVELPPVPTGLRTPSSDGDGTFTVRWNPQATANSYQLQQKTSDGQWRTIYHGPATSMRRSRLLPATYTFRVKSCNSGGCSAFSGSKTTRVYRSNSCRGIGCEYER